MKFLFTLLIALLMLSCSSTQSKTSQISGYTFASTGDVSFGYQPIDPIPIKTSMIDKDTLVTKNQKLMNSLPDESMRLAIGEMVGNMGISFGPVKYGVKNNSYIVILDYIKYSTQPFKIKNDSKLNTISSKPEKDTLTIPVYVGVGLRLTASINVKESGVDLSNFYGLGLAAQQQKINGTLVIQTLGVSGQSVSSLIPMPSELNATTIQNAILSLGAIKAKMYEEDTQLHPRIVGYYNNYVGSLTTNDFISNFLTGDLTHIIGNK